MPNASRHLEIAIRFERFANEFDLSNPDEHTSWATVALFYSALHYMEAYFDLNYSGAKQHHENHRDRNRDIQHDGTVSELWSKYYLLKQKSERVRYDGKKFHSLPLKDCEGAHGRIKTKMQTLGVTT